MNTIQIVLATRPKNQLLPDNFRFLRTALPELEEGEVLLKPLYISVDPYLRGRMDSTTSRMPPFKIDEPITSTVIAIVEESKSKKLKKDDHVIGMLPWATLSVAKDNKLCKIQTRNIPESYYLGILGMPGLTAYFGLTEICKPQPGETTVVSAAAGAVGIIVGQMARIVGSRVVGITGSAEKAQRLKSEFGYDEVINYKTVKDISVAIQEACPNGVDCYFDNVGGEISDAVMKHINYNSRIAICGQIALYNEMKLANSIRILPQILMNSALIQGFMVQNYKKHFPGALLQIDDWLKEGKLKYAETIIEGFEQLPEAFIKLFKGENFGKMIVKTEMINYKLK